jgi:hypothetical protein
MFGNHACILSKPRFRAEWSKNETSLYVFGNETLIAYLEEYLDNLNERALIGYF